VTVAVGHGGGFDVSFGAALGNLGRLFARLTSPLVAVTTTHEGGVTSEVQHLDISRLTANVGYFTLKYRYQETMPLSFGISSGDLGTALGTAFSLLGGVSNVSASGSNGSYDITFSSSLGNVDQILPQLVPLYLAGGGGTDRVRVQSLYEDTFWAGGDGSDSADLNLNPVTLAPFTPTDVVAHVDITRVQGGSGSQDEIQQVVLRDVTGGTFELVFGGVATTAIAWDAPASTVRRRPGCAARDRQGQHQRPQRGRPPDGQHLLDRVHRRPPAPGPGAADLERGGHHHAGRRSEPGRDPAHRAAERPGRQLQP